MSGNEESAVPTPDISEEYLSAFRQCLRITSTDFDGEITDLIRAARGDLVLGGVWTARTGKRNGMSINSILKAALAPVARAEADVYEGKKSVHIMFNYDTVPGNFGDDEPEHEHVLIQAYLYVPTGLSTRENTRRKKALSAAGMTWPGYVNASDKDGQHHIFGCETAQETGDG